MNNKPVKIQVLGSGCPSCKRLHETVKEAVAEMNLGSEVEYVTDIQKIIDMGVMQSPVLVVDGKPIMAGSVPNKEKIVELLRRSLSG
jgi:small redox-active disulfide protein 2